MEKLYINYQEFIEMGFVRFDYLDKVHFRQTGYDPYCLTLDLSKRFKLEVGSDLKECRVFRADKKPFDQNFKSIKVLYTLEEIEFVMDIFGKLIPKQSTNEGT